MTLLRYNSGAAEIPVKRYAVVTIRTESRFKQGQVQGIAEEMLRAYESEDISRWVVESNDITPEMFEQAFSQPVT